MQIRCVHCESLGNVPPNALGKTVRCPRCSNVFEVSEELAAKGPERRRAERLDVDNLDMDFGIVIGTAQVLDMSVTGVGFEPPSTDVDFNMGDSIVCTLMQGTKAVLKQVQVRISRKSEGMFGGEFQGLSELQKAEVKHYLARKRSESAHREEENVELEMDEETLRLKSKGYL